MVLLKNQLIQMVKKNTTIKFYYSFHNINGL